MKTIHKQILETTDSQIIKVPIGSEFLSVGNQHNNTCIWYICDSASHLENRTILTFGTGHPIPYFDQELKFIGTIQLFNGDLIFHIFEKITP